MASEWKPVEGKLGAEVPLKARRPLGCFASCLGKGRAVTPDRRATDPNPAPATAPSPALSSLPARGAAPAEGSGRHLGSARRSITRAISTTPPPCGTRREHADSRASSSDKGSVRSRRSPWVDQTGSFRSARLGDAPDLDADWWVSEASGGKVEDNYELGRVIGRGSYSTVVEGVDRATGERYAVKIVKLPKSRNRSRKRNKVLGEAYLTWTSDHPSILGMREFYVGDDTVVMVLGLMRGGPLFDVVLDGGGLLEPEARLVARQLVSALASLHKRRVVHRDIKLENLLLQWPGGLDSLKVADMGFAVSLAGGPAGKRTMAGTPAYLPPEIVAVVMADVPDPGKAKRTISPAIDMWAMGVSLYLLLSGFPPFEGATTRDLFARIAMADPSFDAPSQEQISPAAIDFLQRLLRKDPAKRMTAVEAAEHPWLTVPDADLARDASFSRRVADVMAREAARPGRPRDPKDTYIKPGVFLKLQQKHAAEGGLDSCLAALFKANCARS